MSASVRSVIAPSSGSSAARALPRHDSKPVVASTQRGCEDAVVHGETGLLVPERDAGAIEAAVARLLDKPELGRRLAEQAGVSLRTPYNLIGSKTDVLIALLEEARAVEKD